MNNDQAGKRGLIAPKVTEGEWTWVFVPSFGQWMLIADDLTPVGIGGPPSDSGNPDKKMLAASKKLAEACEAVEFAIRTERALSGNKAWCGLLDDVRAALKLAGYTEQ
jgi:hypothetical protein